MIFEFVKAKEPVIDEYFCKIRHNNCDKNYSNHYLFSSDGQNKRERCN